ncbi:LysR family transcriptional regulator [Aquabacterium sp. A7-Y]|uniref:LysR family transcriptional regulator n=1 Tax=Aquabacterium sp. A7-Y TaxID=1349605 RepID=UPI00223DBAD7|nr:LysR family transcriptional regulator [Aquabacterium sp. A7-Y]MCW7540358.1 LysR family transcriptional regulator [Aquabacterium sp. A7-Y]
MATPLNYRHLYYFWVVAKEGGIARAAERLDMAVQTVSAQVRELERSLGHTLLKPAGRGVALTEAGAAAMAQAEQIFQLGEQLPALVHEAATERSVRLAVGISDGLPKLAVPHLLRPAMESRDVRLLCHEDEIDDLLADLALHRLDVVLSDRPAPANPNLKLYSHALGDTPVAWYAPQDLLEGVPRDFPGCLAQLPVLLPTTHAALRARLDHWFERVGVRPRVVGEFEDSALLAAFGRTGAGAFPAPQWSHDELTRVHGLQWLGPCTGVAEHFHLITAERRIQHPLVQRLVAAAAAAHPPA